MVVIIFAALILGVLDVLKNEQIGMLLAAIAGYLLGKATTRSQGEGAAPKVPSTALRAPAKVPQSAGGGTVKAA